MTPIEAEAGENRPGDERGQGRLSPREMRALGMELPWQLREMLSQLDQTTLEERGNLEPLSSGALEAAMHDAL